MNGAKVTNNLKNPSKAIINIGRGFNFDEETKSVKFLSKNYIVDLK